MKTGCQILFVPLLFFGIFNCSCDCLGFEPITFTYKGISECPAGEKNPMHWKGNYTKIGQNRYLHDGELTVKEVVTGPIEVLNNYN